MQDPAKDGTMPRLVPGMKDADTVERTRRMQSKRWKVRLACGLMLLPLAGCFSRYPYGSYGPGGYSGIYNTPPAGTIAPNGATIMKKKLSTSHRILIGRPSRRALSDALT